MRSIFVSERTAFKLNASFSYILRHKITGMYRFFYGCHGEGSLFNPARLVNNDATMNSTLEYLTNLDPLEFISEGRENSSWVFEQFATFNLYIFPMEVSKQALVSILTTRRRILSYLCISSRSFLVGVYGRFGTTLFTLSEAEAQETLMPIIFHVVALYERTH